MTPGPFGTGGFFCFCSGPLDPLQCSMHNRRLHTEPCIASQRVLQDPWMAIGGSFLPEVRGKGRSWGSVLSQSDCEALRSRSLGTRTDSPVSALQSTNSVCDIAKTHCKAMIELFTMGLAHCNAPPCVRHVPGLPRGGGIPPQTYVLL